MLLPDGLVFLNVTSTKSPVERIVTIFEFCNGSNNNKNTNNSNNKNVPVFPGESYFIFCRSFSFFTVQKLLPASFLLPYTLLSEKC